MDKIKRIGILTSGGDTPGMNAAINSVVKCAIANGISVMGIQKGFAGLMEGRIVEMREEDVAGIVTKGGTVLRTARSHEFKTDEGIKKALDAIHAFEIDGIVVVGGDGSYKGAQALFKAGVPTIGMPGTIDNDLAYTDLTIGFTTAVNTVAGEIARIRDTMISHERIGVIEVMGNRCGDIALYAGISGGAEHIIVPEVEFEVDEICNLLKRERIKGKKTSIVIISEGAGKGEPLAAYITRTTDLDAKAIVLGYIQRGGEPTPMDRVLAIKMGSHAINLLSQGIGNRVVGIKNDVIIDMDIDEALSVEPVFNNELYELSKILGR